MLEYFTGTSAQRDEALAYFQSNKNAYWNNYLYGHSLGGNLTSHTYLENYNQIKEAFTINGNPINQKLLDTPEKIEAFNDPKKYNCNIICGDIVGHFKSCELYKDNVHYIHNNDSMKESVVSAHLVQSATYDENGKFVYASEEEMIEKMGPTANKFMIFCQNVRERLNELEKKISKPEKKDAFLEYSNSINSNFKSKFDIFKFPPIKLSEIEMTIYLEEFFQTEDEHVIEGVTK